MLKVSQYIKSHCIIAFFHYCTLFLPSPSRVINLRIFFHIHIMTVRIKMHSETNSEETSIFICEMFFGYFACTGPRGCHDSGISYSLALDVQRCAISSSIFFCYFVFTWESGWLAEFHELYEKIKNVQFVRTLKAWKIVKFW